MKYICNIFAENCTDAVNLEVYLCWKCTNVARWWCSALSGGNMQAREGGKIKLILPSRLLTPEISQFLCGGGGQQI